MLYSGESEKAVVSIKPSEHVSDICGYTVKRRIHILLLVMFDVIIINAGLTPG